MPAGPVLRPADAMNAMLHGERHQPVIGGMELHLVDAPPETVESLKLGRIAVRILAPLHRLLRSCRRAQRQQRRLDPFAAECPRGIAQCRVRRVKIPARQRRRHVRHFMGFELRLRSVGCHDRASRPSGGGNSNTVRPGSEPRIGRPRPRGEPFSPPANRFSCFRGCPKSFWRASACSRHLISTGMKIRPLRRGTPLKNMRLLNWESVPPASERAWRRETLTFRVNVCNQRASRIV